MKSRAQKNKKQETPDPEWKSREDEDVVNEDVNPSSITEYIKIKKLQNQVLEKLLENISHPEISKKKSKRENK